MLPIIERPPTSISSSPAAQARSVADTQFFGQNFRRRCRSDACSSFRLRFRGLLDGVV